MPIDAGKRGFEVDSGYSHSRCTIPLMLPHPQVRRTEIKMYNRTAALDRPRAGSFSYSDSSAEPEAEAAPSPPKTKFSGKGTRVGGPNDLDVNRRLDPELRNAVDELGKICGRDYEFSNSI